MTENQSLKVINNKLNKNKKTEQKAMLKKTISSKTTHQIKQTNLKVSVQSNCFQKTSQYHE